MDLIKKASYIFNEQKAFKNSQGECNEFRFQLEQQLGYCMEPLYLVL